MASLSNAMHQRLRIKTAITFFKVPLSIMNKHRKYDIVFVTGDFDVKISDNNKEIDKYIDAQDRRTRFRNMNENGERQLEFCELSNLVITSTTFPQKNIHTVTWYSPDYNTKNQTDNFCTSNKFRSPVKDNREYKGADTGSDHNVCITELEIKFKK